MPPAPRSPPPHRSRGPAPAHLIINPPPREERDSCAEEKKHSCVFEHLKGDDDVVVVSSAYGSQGDVGPLVALARALQRRRVASVVAFVGNGFFRADVENPRTPELRFVEVGTKRGYEDLLVNSHKRKDKRALVRYWLSHLEEHYAALRELLRGRRRVVVVAHPLDLAVRCLEETWKSRASAVGDAKTTSSGGGCFRRGAYSLTPVKTPDVARSDAGEPGAAFPWPDHLVCFTAVLSPAMLRCDDVIHPPLGVPGLVAPKRAPAWVRRLCHRANDAVVDLAFCPRLNAFRRTLGLPPVSRVFRSHFLSERVLAFFPEWFAPPHPQWPPGVHQVGFPTPHPHAHRVRAEGQGRKPFPPEDDAAVEHPPKSLPPEVSRFLIEDPTPYVFVVGSGNPPHASRFFAAAVEATRLLGARAILLTRHPQQVPECVPTLGSHVPGSNRKPGGLESVYAAFWRDKIREASPRGGLPPPGIVHFPFVSLEALLPRCAAVVHNGGVGTCAAAVAAAVPQLVVPAAFDQPDNAARLCQAGVATQMPMARFTPENAKAIAEALRGLTALRRRCEALAETAAAQAAARNQPGALERAAEHVRAAMREASASMRNERARA